GRLGHPRRGPPGPRREHHRFGHDGADLGDVGELRQLAPGTRASRRGEDRVRQLGLAQPAAKVSRHGPASPPARPPPPLWRPPPRPAPAVVAAAPAPSARDAPAARRDLGSQPGAPNASNGIVPTSSQRTCSPRNAGPSTQDRTILVIPSVPVTGSTQVMQTPTPQAISSSTATCTRMSYRRATDVTWRSIGIGPHA